MSQMRDEENPLEVLKKYVDAGERPPADKVMSALLAQIRLTTLSVILGNVDRVGSALALLESELSPAEWVENGLWQDLLDHIKVNYQTLSALYLLQGRITTEQVWMKLDEDEEPLFGLGFPVWDADQLGALPVGCVVRWRDEDGFKVAVQFIQNVWLSPGYVKTVQPEFPAIILASPGDSGEFDCLKKVYEAKKGLGQAE